MEADGMLRHLVFFEELGKMDESDVSWRAVSAGLVTMRLVDAWIADGPTASRVDSWGVSAVREAVAQIPDTTPIKRILTSIVDVMVGSKAIDLHALSPRLMAYGQALEYEAKWALAADVYTTITSHAHPVEDADLAVGAHIQLAFCLRTLGDLDAAVVAYEQASSIAHRANDLMGVLRARLGDAKIAAVRGNMRHADAILEETIARANERGFHQIQSLALGDRAYIAAVGKQWDRVVRYSYEALEHVQSQRTRDRILNNIATAFRDLGLADAARDSYLVIAATADEQYVRWHAEMNLMELSAEQGLELVFDKYRRDLESSDFTPELRVTYLLHVGRGYHVLGQATSSIAYLERAVELAERYSLNHFVFEAEEALAAARRQENMRPKPSVYEADPDLQRIADALHHMREVAVG